MRHHKYWLAVACALAVPSLAVAAAPPGAMTPAPEPAKPGFDPIQQSAVRGRLLPAVAAIDAAKMSTSALHDIVGFEPVHRHDARETAEFAKHAVKFAHTRAKGLAGVDGLSEEAVADTKAAIEKLAAASTTLSGIIRDIGMRGGDIPHKSAEDIGRRTMRLHEDLSTARMHLGKVAEAYMVPLDLELKVSRATP